MEKKIAIILLNYNGYDDTIDCINSIRINENLIEYEIIVVDNLSSDSSYDKLKKIDDIVLIQAGKNNGFAAGNNVGIKYALNHAFEYIYLLNNDTVIEKNSIYHLYRTMENYLQLDIIGSRIMYYDNPKLIQYLGGNINFNKMTSVHNYYKQQYNNELKDEFILTDFITGCSMFIRKSVFDKIGLLPEEYFMYCEDLDYCVKAIENHLKLAVCPKSVIYHKVSSSSGGENSLFSLKWGNRNRLIFMNKYKKKTKFLNRMFFYLTRLILIIKYFIIGKVKKSTAIIDGLKSGIKYIKNNKVGE